MSSKDHNTRVPRPAHNYVPEYQQSGIPFVKTIPALANGNTESIDFDHVTRWFTISTDQNIYLGFSHTGVVDPQKAFLVTSGSVNLMSPRFEIKCKKINLHNLSGSPAHVSVIAGLTNILAKDFPDQTLENGFTGIE